ncbi:DEAD/DEAH box helicase [Virgibacillus sp. YIM 98842]|uniref:DEAD/DEAH box helicase n=1 Tax=Virgibacillus sp. YIM 98842 TaxID=2663533 RepID=UPI0013DA4BD6|nr:DEAD/DEAH box helicase [Virgibacillus sp. YIM 98842]
MSIHPLNGKVEIENAYLDYLKTSFYINDPGLMRKFEEEIGNKNKFSQGPYLEVTAPYKKSKSVQDLMDSGLLSRRFNKVNQEALPVNRKLYSHQVKAVEHAAEGKNFIVATGTGSGKTESFMLPIMNSLFEEFENGTLNPGVRALFVYPMNALANDQMKRLRTLLENNPEITFGRYTGETKEDPRKATETFKHINKDEKLLPNELLSRKEMRETPPNILVTNYAMLEYLLLRPDDTPFFDGGFANDWKYIVLDEAHTYNGAKGIEIGMLLRRLKDRVLKNRPFRGSLQCIATSATLGSGKKAKEKVVQFAENLFDESFTYKHNSLSSIIEADRISYSDYYQQIYQPNWDIYTWLLQLLNKEEVTDADIIKLPEFGINNVSVNNYEKNPYRLIYELLKHDSNLFLLRETLSDKPKKLTTVINMIHNKMLLQGNNIHPDHLEENLIKLVELAVKAKGNESDEPLLPARYHAFIRSIEGAFVQFYPDINFSVETKKYDEETKHPFFELGVCNSCGQPHLIGEEKDGKLIQQQSNQSDENVRFFAYMIVNNISKENVYDEDEELLEGEHTAEDLLYELCPCCSSIYIKGNNASSECCEKGKSIKKILLRKEAVEFDKHSKCNNCGKRSSNPIRQFILGQDGATSVLSTSLYQQLVKGGKREEKLNQESTVNMKNSRFGFLASNNTLEKPKEVMYDPQKLLIFSDSRQSAAYFSPYLESTYKHIVWKNLIYTVLAESEEQSLSVETITTKLIKLAEKQKIYSNAMDRVERKKEAQQYVMRELIKGEERNSLEGVGLIDIKVELPQVMMNNKELIGEQLDISGDEVIDLFNVLFDSFRYYNAMQHPSESDPKDQTFSPKNRQVSMNKKQSQSETNVMSWLPTNRFNKRLDYLMRVYKRKGFSEVESKKKAQKCLQDIWESFIATDQILPNYFTEHKGNKIMSYQYWRISKVESTYRCGTCGILSSRNVSEVCPKNDCIGTLEVFNPQSEFNHYRKLYEEIIPIPMSVKEHTAQLSPETAMNYQNDFVKGKINVLSCSTTFEMGVDVGDLESVFMRNVPPDTANYIQRAGRAGRRKSSVAFVLTYANRRSHDLTFYEKPEDMIAGIVKPPIFTMDNKKIIQRHIHSVILSQFFRRNSDYFGKIEKFFLEDENQSESGQHLLTEFLNEKPKELMNSINNIIPVSAKNEMDTENWGWSKELMITNSSDSLLQKVTTMYYDNLRQLRELAERNFKKDSGSVDVFRRLIKTQLSESLISYFSKHNILPKYGFPVDVVEMQIIDKEAEKIRLNRDLTLAVSEYAPGSQIIANGNIFESVGLRFIRGFELTRKYYSECKNCNYYNMLNENDPNFDEHQMNCESCGELIPINKMIVPSFGFVASKKGKAGERKPLKEFRSRVFFSEYDFSTQGENKELENKEVLKEFTLSAKYSPFGKLAVVNSAKGKGYHLCNVCGSVIKGGRKKPSKHKTPSGGDCTGKYESKPIHLGHEFMSDVLELELENYQIKGHQIEGWPWESLLYAILNGASIALGIDRNDIDGVVHYKNQVNPSIILYDKVPGGAGYMKEIYGQLNLTLKESLNILEMCSCGLETSCYGCLKNYLNQYAHDYLSRGTAIDLLKNICTNLELTYATN